MTEQHYLKLWQQVTSKPMTSREVEFAALVAAAERSECEMVCDAVGNLIATIQNVGMQAGARKALNKACENAAKHVADFRARS